MDLKIQESLQKPPDQRTKQDIYNLQSFISTLDDKSASLCREVFGQRADAVRYQSHVDGDLVYKRGDVANCWYVVLSGSCFIKGTMYIANSSFGKHEPGEVYRTDDCLVLDPSEVMVIDYPPNELTPDGIAYGKYSHFRHLSSDPDTLHEMRSSRMFERRMSENYPGELASLNSLVQQYPMSDRIYYGSMASETSSLYSGSDLMASSLEDQGVDLTGLIESAVDSDDDDEYGGQISPVSIRDKVCESLQKEPKERTEEDLEILLDEIQHLPAFNNMTLATRQALCGVMNYVVIERSDTVVMVHGEELDSWAVILNGHVQISRPDGTTEQLHMGDSFGIMPTREKLYHQGVMHTKVDNCQFVCIPQDDYYRILHEGEENTQRVLEEDKVVLVTEERVLDTNNRKGRVIIRGSPEKLLSQLVEDQPFVDPTYVEDFLLMYRMFLDSPLDVSSKLLVWFSHPPYREKVVSVVLQWVSDHYSDFEMEPKMNVFLEEFEKLLHEQGMKQHLLWLNRACADKAQPRTVVLRRATRDEVLPFSLLGGSERGSALFITKVEPGSKVEEAGLKRGDQILDVNGQTFDRIPHSKALETLRGSTHLSITVRSNMLGFKAMLQAPSVPPGGKRASTRKHNIARMQSESHHLKLGGTLRPAGFDSDMKKLHNDEQRESAFLSTGHRMKIRKALMRFNLIPRSSTSESGWNPLNLHSNHKGSTSGSSSPILKTRFSSSHPDLSTLKLYTGTDLSAVTEPEHVLKVYRADQAFKYLLIYKETTAHEVVMLTLKEFGMTQPSSNYCLCEVTVQSEGFVKQRRLPDNLANLADRSSYNSRYYLKSNICSMTLVPDELKDEILRECQINFLQLNCAEVAAQLSLKDFQLFHNIQPVEYVNDLFQLKSKFGSPHLNSFAQLSNVEMFWVISEVCSEYNIARRAKIIKHFILIAKHCQECKNYNSMFAIISGLGHGSVSRLKMTWDKLPAKYMKLFEDLQSLMDPSRNMSKYRNLIASERPPLIPFYPLIKKDLTFIHLGNDSMVDDLVNYEKLRMIAKEIRHICAMAPAYCDLNGGHWFASISKSAVAMLRQKQRGSTIAIPKKMYEEAQMARKVRAYLAGCAPVEDEVKLNEMSIQCEPPAGGLGMPRRRDEATSPAVLLRQAVNMMPKFGADSPDAVHKLMSLSDRVRPHDPYKNKVTSSVCGVTSVNSFKQSSVMVAPYLTSDSSSVVNHPTQSRSLPGSCESDSFMPRGSGHGSGRQTQKHTETDSGHHSIASTCDSNSTSSVCSTGSPPGLIRTESPLKVATNHSGSTQSRSTDDSQPRRALQHSESQPSNMAARSAVLPPGSHGGRLEYPPPSGFVRKQHSIHRRGNSSRLTEVQSDNKKTSNNEECQMASV